MVTVIQDNNCSTMFAEEAATEKETVLTYICSKGGCSYSRMVVQVMASVKNTSRQGNLLKGY
jgi:hypothetical protein